MVVSIFEMRGGAVLAEIEPAKYTWSLSGNDAETVDITIDLGNAVDAERGWANLASAWNHCVAVELPGGRVLGGPIMPNDFDDDKSSLQITSRGLRVALARVPVMPATILSLPLLVGGKPNPALDTTLSGWDLGTTGAKLLEQALTLPGWTDVPMTFEMPRAGDHTESWQWIDRVPVDEAWSNLSSLANGPDIRVELVRVSTDQFGWRYRSGSAAQPRLISPEPEGFTWEIGSGSGLAVKTNPTRMGSLSFALGGRSDDKAEVAMQYDSHLIDRGFPLMVLDANAPANTAAEQLPSWNVETLRTARVPWTFWSFNVRADRAPFPNEYGPGDLINLVVTQDTPVSGGYVAAGTYTRRIAALQGDEDEQWITITCGENYG